MTGVAPFGLIHGYGPEWVHVMRDHAADGFDAWAQQTARRVAQGRRERSRTKSYYQAIGAEFLRQGGVEAYLLVPPGEVLVRTMVRCIASKGPATHAEFAAMVRELRPAGAEEVVPTQLDDVSTAAGTAARMITRTVVPDRAESPVLEAVNFFWWFPDWQATILQVAEYNDLVGMDPWLPSLGALALEAVRTPAEDGTAAPATLGLAPPPPD